MKKTIYFLLLTIIFMLFSCGNEKQKTECKSGFEYKESLNKCIDIDECKVNNGGCEENCINNDGSFECSCNEGFKLDVDNKTCIDIDECKMDNAGCEQVCSNTEGSFKCSCESGYILNEDAKTCINIDDCKEDSCRNHGECIDGVNNFTCKCDEGYDGTNCEECAEGYEFYGGKCLSSAKFVSWGTDDTDEATSFIKDSSNNLYVVGYTAGAFEGYDGRTTSYRLFLTKFNDNLDILWTHEYEIRALPSPIIRLDEDNNLFITINDFDNHTDQINSFLLKIDTDGNLLWNKKISAESNFKSVAMDLDENNDIYIIGKKIINFEYSNNIDKIFIIIKKLDSSGNLLWSKERLVQDWSENDDFKRDILSASLVINNNIYIGTITNIENSDNIGENDIILLKYDKLGNEIWEKRLGSEKQDEVGKLLIKDNEIYITGYENGLLDQWTGYGAGDIFLTKLDDDGNILFHKSWIYENKEYSAGIAISDNNEIYISGFKNSFAIKRQLLLKKLNSSGELIWEKEWPNHEKSAFNEIMIINNSLYALGIQYIEDQTDPFIMKLDLGY